MIGASSLAFPGSKTLASWWRQLTAWHPLAYWVGYLFVHRIEALVGSVSLQPVDRFSLLLLQALALESAAAGDEASTAGLPTTDLPQPVGLDRLNARLQLGQPFLLQTLRQLAAAGLVEVDGRGQWTTTHLGREALRQGHFGRFAYQRRLFHFLERLQPGGDRLALPHFLDLRDVPGVAWQPDEDFRFQTEWLQACLDQSEAWKNTFGFPLEVRTVAGVSPFQAGNHPIGLAEPEKWQQVIVDQPERLLVVLALAGPDLASARLLGLAARQEGWSLQTPEPLFALNQGWEELFSETKAAAQPECARLAWQAWAKTAGLSTSECDACEAVLGERRLRVRVPDPVRQRLRSLRGDVFKGDTWLLVGEGRLRLAVTLEIVSGV